MKEKYGSKATMKVNAESMFVAYAKEGSRFRKIFRDRGSAEKQVQVYAKWVGSKPGWYEVQKGEAELWDYYDWHDRSGVKSIKWVDK